MNLFDLFKQPYLDIDNGGNLGGGEPSPTPTPEPTPAPEPTPTPEGGNEPTPELPKIKVKYNHQEMELPYDEAVTHIQKGMNYDKAVERAREEAAQTAIDKYIASQGYEWNGKPITTEAEYQEALREKELLDKGVDPNEVKRIAEELPEVKEARQLKRDREQFQELSKEFPGITLDQIPTEVLKEYENGKDLTDAYARWKVRQIHIDEAKAKAEAEKAEANKANATASMGSVSGDGGNPEEVTEETINRHANDTNWMMKNYEKVQAFYRKKKG